jgi:hypothetical protein
MRDHSVNSDEDEYQEQDYDIPSHMNREVLGYRMQENDDEVYVNVS